MMTTKGLGLAGLVEELGIPTVTSGELARERAQLARKIFLRYHVHPEEIDDLISSGGLPEDELVVAWIDLAALMSCAHDPPRLQTQGLHESPRNEGRESGLSFFRTREIRACLCYRE